MNRPVLLHQLSDATLVQYQADTGIAVGIQFDQHFYAAPQLFGGRTLLEIVEDWPHWSTVLRTLDDQALTRIPVPDVIAPLTYPNKVICAGANYYDHAEEMGAARPDPHAEPFFFLKSPTTTVVGPSAQVPINTDGRSKVDWEAELGVVIGRRTSAVEETEAAQAIAGYVVANDISDRGVFRRTDSVNPAFDWDWLGHKNQDAFCPIGPGLVPAWLVPDPHALKIRLVVNWVVKQDSNTSQMVVGVPRLIAAANKLMTLEPGDIILTGTPAGVGAPRHDFLSPGDVVTAEIEGVGRIRNTVVGK
jgi:2-keto-4-pentenoate hydratase/2-oxohepta-3-ene-1,7-dioic acid hydratase in catechol pathway